MTKHDQGSAGVVALVLLAVVGAVALGIAVYLGVAATANVRGKVAVHNEVYSGQSRLEFTRHFHDLDGQIQADVAAAEQNYQTYVGDQRALAGQPDPFGQNAQTLSRDLADYHGAVTNCQRDTTAYNAAVDDSTRGVFLEANLPTHHSITECEAH